MDDENGIRRYLCEEIFPQILPPPYGEIEIHRFSPEKPVYLFTEKIHHILAVGKSFKHHEIPLEQAWQSADREFTNLKTARDQFDMHGDFGEFVRPLGEKKELSALLVTQKAPGNLLDYYIIRAIYEQQRLKLFEKLGFLAKFFAKLHKNSQTTIPVSSSKAQSYLEKILANLMREQSRHFDISFLEKLAGHWWNKAVICREDSEVMVHGDATPTNFLIQHQKVTGIDLERMCHADRCWDLGFLAAELKHHFYWRTGDRWAAEPFIGHFLWEYAGALDDRDFFYTITAKLPLYMALGILRMTRNTWLDHDYRRALIKEAELCLR